MNWENCDFASDGEEETKAMETEDNISSSAIFEYNERKKDLRLGKVIDPSKDEHRKAYIAMVSGFGELLLAENYDEIIKHLFTEDCEVFMFNFGEIAPVKYTLKPQELSSLFQGAKVIKRDVKETNFDSDCATAFQICYCEIYNEQNQTTISQFSMQMFSFRDGKISKLRAGFGSSNSFDEFNHPFIPTPKEIMLAKAKQLHFAWAGQPDLERIASLFHPTTEYKIWRWDDQKAFTFTKNDFAGNFRQGLEENYEIKCVVPYYIYNEGPYIMSNYVFHLEDKNGEKFIWLSTCAYIFDKHLNMVKINQQGDLRRQDEIEIPFEAYPKEEIRQKIIDGYVSKQVKDQDSFFLDTSQMNFSVELCKFVPTKVSCIGHIKGFSDYSNLSKVFTEKNNNFEWDKVVDFYIDHSDASYDTAFTFECLRASQRIEELNCPGKEMIFICFKKFYIEHGKVARVVLFSSDLREAIPSPYDDKEFTTENIRRKEDFCIHKSE